LKFLKNSIFFFFNGELFVVIYIIDLEQLAVRIGQEVVSMECVADRVIFDPLAFLLSLLHAALFLDVVSELVIRDNVRIVSLCILDAVGVIIVLRRSLDDQALSSQLVQQSYLVR
jgi:hypothetical protein